MLSTALMTVAGVIFCFVTVLFVVSLVIKRNDIADVAWGTGVLLVCLVSLLRLPEPTPLMLLLTVLASLWGIRLTVRIGYKNLRSEEDARYKRWRDSWGVWFVPRSYAQVFLLQGFLMVVVGYPFIHASVFGGAAEITPLVLVGVFIWIVGFVFEVVGDLQLDRFIARKKAGKTDKNIMTKGLWQYSRHPNYFGEVTMWWGIWLMIAAVPYAVFALIGPMTITFLILKVSGVPLLEEKYAGEPEWEAYKEKTSVFFPWPPKQTAPK